jgi:hypothetical protein
MAIMAPMVAADGHDDHMKHGEISQEGPFCSILYCQEINHRCKGGVSKKMLSFQVQKGRRPRRKSIGNQVREYSTLQVMVFSDLIHQQYFVIGEAAKMERQDNVRFRYDRQQRSPLRKDSQ